MSANSWNRTTDTSAESEAVTIASDGSIYISGNTGNDLDGEINNGGRDAFVIKYTSNGTKQWTKLLGGANYDSSNSVATSSDGSIYISGFTRSNLFDGEINNGSTDAFITKFSSDGTKQWTRLLGGLSSRSNSVATSADGSIYISGSTTSDLDGEINNGGRDAFLAKYASDGTKQWTKLIGGTSLDSSNGVATASDGSIYISGSTSSDFDGVINSGSSDAFIAKYASDGTKQWTQLLGGTNYDSSNSVATTNDGSIYISGHTYSESFDGRINNGGLDAFITKYASDGTKKWTQLLGGASNDISNSVATSEGGAICLNGCGYSEPFGTDSIYISGSTSSDLDGETNSGGSDAFITKYASSGNKQWTKLLGGTSNDASTSVATGSDGAVVISGYGYSDPFEEDDAIETPKGGSKYAFLSKVNNSPSLRAGNTLIYKKLDDPTVISSSLTLVDVDNSYMESATIAISSGFVVAEDVLAFANTSDISGSYNAATGVLSLSGSATKAQYETALRSITYDNTAYNTNTSDRTVSWVVNDGDVDSSTVTSTIKVDDSSSFATAWNRLTNSSTTKTAESEAIAVESDGSIYMTGSTSGDLDGEINSGSNDVFIAKYASDGTKKWTQLLGGISSDLSNAVATASDGSIYISGSTHSDLDGEINSGSNDAFLTKYTSDGTKQWTQLIGGISADSSNGVATTSDGSIYISGYTESESFDGEITSGSRDAFITKYASDGTKEWTQLLGGEFSDSSNGVATASDGSIYISGSTFSDLDGETHTGSGDAFLTKYTSDGTKQWTKLIGGGNGFMPPLYGSSDTSNSVATSSDGSVYISGTTFGYSFDGISMSPAGTNAFITKYAGDGTKQWTQLMVGFLMDSSNGVATTSDGSVYISGSTSNNLDINETGGSSGSDAFITKYSSDGLKQWTHQIGGLQNDGSNSVATGSDGALFISGYSNSDPFDEDDESETSPKSTTYAFLSKLNLSPILSGAGNTLSFKKGDGPKVVESDLTLTDAGDSHIESATIAISAGFSAEEDVLAFVNTSEITGSYNAVTGVLILSGSATKAQYESALVE